MASEVATSYGVARSKFKELVATGWTESADLPVEWPNAELNPKPVDKAWARFSIIEGEATQVDTGATTKRFRNIAVMVIQIFVPLGKGTAETESLVDRIRNNFSGKKYSNVVFRVCKPVTVGKTEAWWQTNVVCPFFFDDIV